MGTARHGLTALRDILVVVVAMALSVALFSGEAFASDLSLQSGRYGRSSSAGARGDFVNGNWAAPVDCNLLANGDGTTTIVCPTKAGGKLKLVLKTYTKAGKLKGSKRISVPGQTWGGAAYRAPNGRIYVATGTGSGDSGALMYVSQFSPKWKLLRTCAVGREETRSAEAFHGGNCSMAEIGGVLYVAIGRLRADGHQSDLTLAISTADMSLRYNQGASFTASHDFSTVVATDGVRLVRADQGDGNPRGVYVNEYVPDGSEPAGSFRRMVSYLPVLKAWHWPGQNMRDLSADSMMMLNQTGMTLDDVMLGKHNDLVIGSSVPHDRFASEEDFAGYMEAGSSSGTPAKNLYVALVAKGGSASSLKWLTSFAKNSKKTVHDVKVVSRGKDRFGILFGVAKGGEPHETRYVEIDSTGKVLKSRKLAQPFICTSSAAVQGSVLMWCYGCDAGYVHHQILYRYNLAKNSLDVSMVNIGPSQKFTKLTDFFGDARKGMAGVRPQLKAGAKATLTARLYGKASQMEDNSNTPVPLVWKSSKPSVVSVLDPVTFTDSSYVYRSAGDRCYYKESKVRLKAKSPGKAKVTVQAGAKKLAFAVAVTPRKR